MRVYFVVLVKLVGKAKREFATESFTRTGKYVVSFFELSPDEVEAVGVTSITVISPGETRDILIKAVCLFRSFFIFLFFYSFFSEILQSSPPRT